MDQTIYQAFEEIARRYPNRTALKYKRAGAYNGMTYRELETQVDRVSASISELGLAKGDSVGIISFNRPEWVIADLAALKLGCVVVPVCYKSSAAGVRYMSNDSNIRLLFVENAESFSIVESARNEIPCLWHVVVMDASGISDKKDVLEFEALKAPSSDSVRGAGSVSAADIATIVYTSGTTGQSKGVMLTHSNILSNARCAIKRFGVMCTDSIVSYLPVSHMFERSCGYYAVLLAGGTIAFAESLSSVARDVATMRPTLLLAVPGVIEKAYGEAVKKVEKASFATRSLVASAVRCLNMQANLKYRKMRVPLLLRAKCVIFNIVVSRRFRKVAGGRLRLIISGGAPLDRRIAKTLYVLGFNIVEGYGLTEASPVVSSNTLEENRLGSVGKPFEGVEIKVAADGEILVRGLNVMKGYHNKPEETDKAIDRDGWLHTGDLGRFESDGNLVITGRLKELIVTSYGKKVAPAPIEQRIRQSRYIDQAMLWGDRQKCIIAIIVPNEPSIRSFARTKGVDSADYASLLNQSDLRELIRNEIAKATADLASYERPRAFILRASHLTPENSLLTATLKLRRAAVYEKHKAEIEALYRTLESPNSSTSTVQMSAA